MVTITHVEPNNLALFYSTDVDPGFAVKLCNRKSLFGAVMSVMYFREPDDKDEINAIVDELLEGGGSNFEDGWLKLCTGMLDTVAFVMEKAAEAKAGERFEDGRRYEELQRREAAEAKYEVLRQALVEALGGRSPDVLKAAAA